MHTCRWLYKVRTLLLIIYFLVPLLLKTKVYAILISFNFHNIFYNSKPIILLKVQYNFHFHMLHASAKQQSFSFNTQTNNMFIFLGFRSIERRVNDKVNISMKQSIQNVFRLLKKTFDSRENTISYFISRYLTFWYSVN
jgi:hypothetical protein